MNKQIYENLMDMLEREVKDIVNKGDFDSQSIDTLFKVMMSIKAVDKHMETMGSSHDYSGRRSHDGSYDGSYRSYNRSYDRSYGSYDDMSRDNFRYSQDSMKRKLESMMSEASNDSDRMAIMECLNKMK